MELNINNHIFKVKYLPDFADYILKNKLEEFVLVGIRFCREANLPVLKPLAKFSESELVALSLESNQSMLKAIASNKIAAFVENKAQKWIANKLGIIDQDEVVAEDLTVGFHIRRKTFGYFLEAYTVNTVLHKLIMEELDRYTTHEELISYSIYLQIQQNKISRSNEQLEIQKKMLLETQELAEIGSYLIDFEDRSRSIYTAMYNRILEIDGQTEYEFFLTRIPSGDLAEFRKVVDPVLKNGGEAEVEYTYLAPSGAKRIWSKAIIESAGGKPKKIQGTIRDITKKYNLISKLKETEALYKQAQELHLLGNWSWELSSGKLAWSSQMYKLFEIEEQSPVSLSNFIDFIHPDDKERIKEEIQKIGTSPNSSEYVYRIVTPKGNIKLLRGVSIVETNNSKVVVKCYGTCQDISSSSIMKEGVAVHR